MSELHEVLREFFKHEKNRGVPQNIQEMGMRVFTKCLLDEVYEK